MNKCLLCETDGEDHEGNHDTRMCECKICGQVRVYHTLIPALKNKYKKQLWLLSAFCRKQTKSGLPATAISFANVDTIINSMKKPASVTEAQHRLVKYFANKSDLRGSWISYDINMYLDVVIERGELPFLLRLLYEQHYLYSKRKSVEDEVEPIQPSRFEELVRDGHRDWEMRLTGSGWEKYDDILNANFDSDKVFVAMWYSDKTIKLREALRIAISEAGYNPIIADEGDFTGNIMDFVLGSIKQSRFVIADFTTDPEQTSNEKRDDKKVFSRIKEGARGGVYYEAGFAKGLGLEVIHTCKDDDPSKSRLHFDVEHDNTIFWTDEDVKGSFVRKIDERQNGSAPQNLSEKLYDRIVRLFGIGPLKTL